MPKKISKEDIINDILRVFELGNTTREFYLKHGKYSKTPITRLFGGWNKLLQELNQDLNMHKNVTKDAVIKDMQNLYLVHGKLTAEIQRKYSSYSQPVVDRLFGSFTDLLRELNLPIDGRFVTNEEIKQSVQDIYNKHGFVSQVLIQNYCIVSAPTICSRFGSMQNLCDELNILLFSFEDLSKLAKFVLGVVAGLIDETPKLEYTFDWLVNDKTGKNLYVDAYYSEHNLVIEIDGEQHVRENSFYHNSKDDFIKSQYRDDLKDSLVKEHNLDLIRIAFNDNVETIKSKLSSFI